MVLNVNAASVSTSAATENGISAEMGASYVGTASEHLANRGMFAGSQELAAATYTATDILNNTALGLG